MLTFFRKSSSVSSFLQPAIGLHGVQSFLYERPFVLKDSLICFADRGKGEQDWHVRGDFRFMNFTTFCLLIFKFYNFLFFWENYFFTHDIYPHPHPRLTTSTHYPRHLATLYFSPFLDKCIHFRGDYDRPNITKLNKNSLAQNS